MAKRLSNYEAAIKIISILREQGYEAYLVGGCVRDMLIGRKVNDHDIATNAKANDVFRLFKKTLKVGAQFGVAMVCVSGEWIEVATFRRDQNYVDGRRPTSIKPGTINDDAERRDFTINGLYLDPDTEKIIDLVNGKIDIENHLIRAIGDPRERFEEDRLRMLRAIRFAAQLSNFEIHPETASAIKEFAPQITDISSERILEEFRKILICDGRKLGIELADKLGLLSHIFPELITLKNYSKDAFDQTLCVLENLGKCNFETAAAALFHLIGLPKENPLACKSKIRPRLNASFFNGSASLADNIARRLTCSNDEREKITALIEFTPLLSRADTLSLADIKRLKIYKLYDDLRKILKARIKANLESPEKIKIIDVLAKKIDPKTLKNPPLISGQDLINECGLEPSPAFQKILDEVYDAQLNEEINTKAQAIEKAVKLIM